MNQRTHSWIAVRAIALLQDENQERNLCELLKPHAREASVGAWIPDQIDAKRGGSGSSTDNHIFKTLPYEGDQVGRFVTHKEELLEHVGGHRLMAEFLHQDEYLDDTWWDKPYRGDVDRPGQHLPNRAMGLSTMMKDLLLLGNETIDRLIPGDVRFAESMVPETRTEEEAAAMYFFMLSHFLADACMPCHCDGRKLAGYDEGLHKELEAHWSKKVGTYFEKDNLLGDEPGPDSAQVLEQARGIDDEFGIDFGDTGVPDLIEDHDVWLEMIYQGRASFALASIIAPYRTYPYDNPDARAPFDEVLEDGNPELLAEVDRIVMHDAVLNTAIIWKHVWNKVSKE